MDRYTKSKIVNDGPVKSAALTKLRCADADAAAVAQLVNFVEKIHHIEADFETARPFRNFYDSLKAKVYGSVIGNALGVGKAATESASVKEFTRQSPIVPRVGAARGRGPTLDRKSVV